MMNPWKESQGEKEEATHLSVQAHGQYCAKGKAWVQRILVSVQSTPRTALLGWRLLLANLGLALG